MFEGCKFNSGNSPPPLRIVGHKLLLPRQRTKGLDSKRQSPLIFFRQLYEVGQCLYCKSEMVEQGFIFKNKTIKHNLFTVSLLDQVHCLEDLGFLISIILFFLVVDLEVSQLICSLT